VVVSAGATYTNTLNSPGPSKIVVKRNCCEIGHSPLRTALFRPFAASGDCKPRIELVHSTDMDDYLSRGPRRSTLPAAAPGESWPFAFSVTLQQIIRTSSTREIETIVVPMQHRLLGRIQPSHYLRPQLSGCLLDHQCFGSESTSYIV
jgi:hypothetical protein